MAGDHHCVVSRVGAHRVRDQLRHRESGPRRGRAGSASRAAARGGVYRRRAGTVRRRAGGGGHDAGDVARRPWTAPAPRSWHRLTGPRVWRVAARRRRLHHRRAGARPRASADDAPGTRGHRPRRAVPRREGLGRAALRGHRRGVGRPWRFAARRRVSHGGSRSRRAGRGRGRGHRPSPARGDGGDCGGPRCRRDALVLDPPESAAGADPPDRLGDGSALARTAVRDGGPGRVVGRSRRGVVRRLGAAALAACGPGGQPRGLPAGEFSDRGSRRRPDTVRAVSRADHHGLRRRHGACA